MCDCREKKEICEDHTRCVCEPFNGKITNYNLYINLEIDALLVGHSHQKINLYCCEWLNTCYLLYVNYDPKTKCFIVRDKNNNIFCYEDNYILSF